MMDLQKVKNHKLGFTPVLGTEGLCDRSNPKIPQSVCVPNPQQLDLNKVYGCLEGGGGGQVSTKVGKAELYASLSFSYSTLA